MAIELDLHDHRRPARIPDAGRAFTRLALCAVKTVELDRMLPSTYRL